MWCVLPLARNLGFHPGKARSILAHTTNLTVESAYALGRTGFGGLAHQEERLFCKQEAVSSSLTLSTNFTVPSE